MQLCYWLLCLKIYWGPGQILVIVIFVYGAPVKCYPCVIEWTDPDSLKRDQMAKPKTKLKILNFYYKSAVDVIVVSNLIEIMLLRKFSVCIFIIILS
jgi:hypothetical protein